MRISDWSSDVCSSDLTGEEVVLHRRRFHEARGEDVVVVGVHRGGAFARETEPERRLRIDLSRVREQRVEPHAGIALDVVHRRDAMFLPRPYEPLSAVGRLELLLRVLALVPLTAPLDPPRSVTLLPTTRLPLIQ